MGIRTGHPGGGKPDVGTKDCARPGCHELRRELCDERFIGIALRPAQLMIEMGQDQLADNAFLLQDHQGARQGDAVGTAGHSNDARAVPRGEQARFNGVDKGL